MRIQVAEDDNSIFGAIRNAIYLFDFGKGHGGKGITDDWTKELILFLCDIFPGLGVNMQT